MATRAPSKRVVRKAPRFDDAGPAVVRVVAIGASAGGLEAFIDLVSAIPADTGLAFVLIQHLDPRHSGRLGEELATARKAEEPS
jgi:two-component system CheB/CheR fusion protein